MPKKSESSEYSSSDDSDYSNEDNLDRLAELERILKSSLGFIEEIDDRPTKRVKIDDKVIVDDTEEVPEISAPIELGEEIVAFRLFSTQRLPTAIIIRESEIWETVADPRIRDVDDEAEEVVEARRLRIESISIDGSTILSQAISQPPRFPLYPPTKLLSTIPLGLSPSLAKITAKPIQEITSITLLPFRSSKSKQKRIPRQLPRHSYPTEPQTIIYHRLINSEIPLTPQQQLERSQQLEKQVRQARIAATQKENDERGRLNRLEKLKRKTEAEEVAKVKEGSTKKIKKSKSGAVAKERRAAKRLQEREGKM